jgi:dCTP deaminase
VVAAILSDEIVVTPLISVKQIGMTVDLRLGTVFGVRKLDRLTHFDPVDFREEQAKGFFRLLKYYEIIKRVDPTVPFILHPGRFALGSTLEYVILPDDISGILEGRSGWAREGLNVHSTASFIHPGHTGSIVFELNNVGSHPLPLYPGTRVAQMRFVRHRFKNTYAYGHGDDDKYGIRVHAHGVETAGRIPISLSSDSQLTMFGRPWQDWEFGRIAEAKEAKRLEGND